MSVSYAIVAFDDIYLVQHINLNHQEDDIGCIIF